MPQLAHLRAALKAAFFLSAMLAAKGMQLNSTTDVTSD
jgi:hypothetical protein